MSTTRTPPAPQAPATPRAPSAAAATAAPRTDIQALRALAVALVLAFHLWPQVLTGGFVGVDVFFLISGFLITSHLLAHPPRAFAEVAEFWARRIRRLLPASLLVLGVTVVASRLFAPETQWLNTAKQAGFAAVYGLNWLLAADAVDYLAAENQPTPVQHFWSLSVEEQFYFVWPILIGALVWAGARRSRPGAVVIGLAAVAGLFLAVSVTLTATNPTAAYFVTPTRAWEFALGGLLAGLVARRRSATGRSRLRLTTRGRSVLAAAGLGAIAVAAVTFDGRTPFPGASALLPTLGTAAVIAAGLSPEVGVLGRALATPGIQVLGDLSYSVYLWHWPLIVLLPAITGAPLTLGSALLILVLTVALAAVTKRYVEDPVRRLRPRKRQVFIAAALGMAVVLTLCGAQAIEVAVDNARAEQALAAARQRPDRCLGAGALLNSTECRGVTRDSVIPAPAAAAKDKSEAYADVSHGRDCWSYLPDYPVVTCTFGNPAATRRIALVGNSHAGQWLPALQRIAEQRGWGITTYLASRCAMNPTPQAFDTSAHVEACRSWVQSVSDAVIAEKFDVVVLTNRMSLPARGSVDRGGSIAAYQAGYEQLLQRWDDAGVTLLALHDTPAPGDAGIRSIPDCVAANGPASAACDVARSAAVAPEPLFAAVDSVAPRRVVSADLNDAICAGEVCHSVVGGVLVYFDASHLTATYARTLAPALSGWLDRALAR